MTDREVVEKWRAHLLDCWAKDYCSMMTSLLEDGPQYEVESKAGKAVEELESIPPPGYTLRTKWYNACECSECDPYGLKHKSRTAIEAALLVDSAEARTAKLHNYENQLQSRDILPEVVPDVSLDRLTDQRITEEPNEFSDDPYGMARAAEFPLVVNQDRRGIAEVTESQDLCGVYPCVCGGVFQSLPEIKKHLGDLVNKIESDPADDGPEIDVIRRAKRR